MTATERSELVAPQPYVTPVNKNDEWATPLPLFDQWNRKLRFTIDAAASALNAKLPRFWNKDTDALRQSWANERPWINPPWSKVAPWVGKALERESEITALLLPARTDTSWFRELETDRQVYTEFLGRVAFLDPESRGRSSPREGAMIAVVL